MLFQVIRTSTCFHAEKQVCSIVKRIDYQHTETDKDDKPCIFDEIAWVFEANDVTDALNMLMQDTDCDEFVVSKPNSSSYQKADWVIEIYDDWRE